MSSLAPILQGFFTEKLINQRQASAHTIAAYRDTFRLLLDFAQQTTGTEPWRLDLAQLDADLVTAFLGHLQTHRGNSARTRNARLAAIRSMFRYAAVRSPGHAETIQRVLAIPGKRTDTTIICFLNDDERDALLTAPDRTTWIGRRDHTLLLVALQTGLRVSELNSLTCHDIHLGTGAHLRCTGKGRKQRCTPLTPTTVTTLRDWLAEHNGTPTDPVFCSRQGTPLSPDAIQARITKYQAVAAQRCPSIAVKRLSPHTLRHSTAMGLLHAGVDTTVIALWLGCAARRSVVSPAQRAERRGDISGSDG